MIDSIDLKILKVMKKLETEECSPWFVMRRIFPKGSDSEVKKIKWRMERLEKIGLFMIEKNSPRHFQIIEENVLFKTEDFPDILSGKKRKSSSVWLNINNKWQVFEL